MSDISPALTATIVDLSSCDISTLPDKLRARSAYDGPKGDLADWVPVLNRIDGILATIIDTWLIEDENPRMLILDPPDEEMAVSCLNFTANLLEYSNDKKLYASSERIYHLIKCASFEVKLAALRVAEILAEKFCETSSKKFAAPKAAKHLVLCMARCFPPRVPPNYAKQIQDNEESKEDQNHENDDDTKPNVIGDFYSWIDTINPKKKYPDRWKSINYSYYRSYPQEEHRSRKAESEGLHTFVMSEESVRSMDLQQIFIKGSEVIPKESWFEFVLVVYIAKAFNSNSDEALKLRKRLLQMKCYSIGFLSCMCPASFTSTRLFEVEPYIFTFLVELINPDNSNKVNENTLFAALRALECISLKKAWGSDIIRCLGGNVSHGLLYQCLRSINKQVRDNDPLYHEWASIRFFNIIGSLINTRFLASRLTAGGILNDLLSFFNIQTIYRSTCSLAVHYTSIYLSTVQQQFEEFANKNGFKLLIDTIQYEVEFALNNEGYDGGPPTDIVVHYSINYKQAAYIKNLVKLVSDLIETDSGDRLRNLFDSPLLDSFNTILLNPNVFGASILSPTLDCVFYIIHNEPTAFSILNEAGVIDTILVNYEKLFLPSANLLLSLPEVLGAICLNKEGMKKIIDHKSIETYLMTLSNPQFADKLVKANMSTSLGCSFDELGRHHTSLKPVVLSATNQLLQAFVKKCPLQGVQWYNDTSPMYNSRLDEVELIPNNSTMKDVNTWDNSSMSVTYDNLYFFLGGLLQDSQWGSAALETIPFEQWLSFLELDAPYDYILSNSFDQLKVILKFFDDEDRAYGLPVLIASLNKYLKHPLVQSYLNYTNNDTSYFTTLNASDATTLVQHLNVLNTLIRVLSSTHVNYTSMFHERVLQIVPLLVHQSVVTDLVKLLARSIVEENAIRSRLPDKIEQATRPVVDVGPNYPPLPIFSQDPDKETPPDIGDIRYSAKYKNALQLRFINNRLENGITKVLNAVGKLAMHKRHDHSLVTWRRQVVELTLELGEALSVELNKQFDDVYLQHCYILIYVNATTFIMSQMERGKQYLVTPLAISVFQAGFFTKISEWAPQLWRHMLEMPVSDVQSTSEIKFISIAESSIVRNGLSQILALMAKAVNSDSYLNLPAAKLFFHRGYGKDIENKVTSALLIQLRLIAVTLLKELVGPDSLSVTPQYIDVHGVIPTPIIDQLVKIAVNVYLGKKEFTDGEFIPLTVNNVSPPLDQVNYLISLGMPESQAEHYFRHDDDIRNIPKGNWSICAQMNITTSQWQEYASAINESAPDFDFDLPHDQYRPSSQLRYFRLAEKDTFVVQWMEVAKQYAKAVPVIAEMFLSLYVDSKEIVRSVFGVMTEAIELDRSSIAAAACVHTLSHILKNERASRSNSGVFEQFRQVYVEEMTDSQSFNVPYAPYALAIIEQMVVYSMVPIVEVSNHEDLNFHGSDVPYRLSTLSKQEVFESLLRIESLTNRESALRIARLLVLFSSDEGLARQIASSSLLKSLIQLSHSVDKENEWRSRYNSVIVVVLRHCFETTKVLKGLFGYDTLVQFQNSTNRELKTCLKDQSPLMFRSYSTYVDVVARDIRLEGYDGIPPIHLNRLMIERVKSSPSQSEDVIMSEPEEPESTGIMHILVMELMNVVKAPDWPTTDTSYRYASSLLAMIIELVASYKQAKLEFVTFSKRKQDDKLKPRPTAINFFLYQLIPTKSLELGGTGGNETELERRSQVSKLAKLGLYCLMATPIIDSENCPDPKSENGDMESIRRFLVELVHKSIREIASQSVLAVHKYSKLLDLFEVCCVMLSPEFEQSGRLTNKQAVKYDQYYVGRAFSDRSMASMLTGIIATLDLNFPDIERVAKSALKPISILARIKSKYSEYFSGEDEEVEQPVPDENDEDIRDDTPDLFRNSSLGMYDVEYSEEEESDDFYDEDGPLEVEEVSGSDLSEIEALENDSEDDEEILAGLDSEDDDDEDEEDDDDDDDIDDDSEDESIDGFTIDIDSDAELDDIEIIDELELEGEGEDEEDVHHHHHQQSSDIDSDADEPPRTARIRRDTRNSFIESNDDDESEEVSDEDAPPSMFDATLRRGSQAFAVLLDSLGGIRGSIEINDHSVGRNSLGRVFESILNRHDKSVSSGYRDEIQSTKMRWLDTFEMFYPYDKEDMVARVGATIFKVIESDSLTMYHEKQAAAERARKEREARVQKREEEERQRRAEEERQRQEEEEEEEAGTSQLDPVYVRIGEREVDISGTDIDPEFFEALPDDMREEVFTQHVRERRANAARTGAETREIDPDFLAALPDQIREEILQQESFGDGFDDEFEEEEGEEVEPVVPEITSDKDTKGRKILSSPLVDKAGVYALVKLLFAPLTLSYRHTLYYTLECICRNKQSRLEFLNLLVAILHDGLSNQRAIEKVYAQISAKAVGKEEVKKAVLPTGSTILFVSIQLIEALDFILERNVHFRLVLLSEHENPLLKRTKAGHKFALNFLLKLLDNSLLRNDQTFMDILARVMEVSTKLLPVLSRRPGFVAPAIPAKNYRQFIQILTANECSNATFRRTISAMQNLSVLPHAQSVFSHELSDRATSLGHVIIGDLQAFSRDLQADIESAVTSCISKFSAASSDQSKLLRILTALDYMFESKEKSVEAEKEKEKEKAKEKKEEEEAKEKEQEKEKEAKDKEVPTKAPAKAVDEIEELTGLYRKLALGSLWDALSDCLRILQERNESTNVAAALLPLIESLMVVCKHSKVKELSSNREITKYEARRIDFTKEPIESLFFSFTDEHKKILNQMVRTNANLMSGPFGMLVKNPRVLEFDNKKNYFDRQIHTAKNESSKLSINIRRDQVFLDSYRSLFFKSSEEFKKAKLEINFKGEAGVDAGGVTREWYQVLSRQMFNPDYALFTPVASDETTFHPNRTSYINPEHLSFFKFIGRIIGKAIYDGSYLDCHFSRAVYKRILGFSVSLKDMETLDLEYFKSLMWMLENDITDVITEDFSVETDDYGEHKVIDLIPNGRNIPVTEANKHEYVKKVVEYRLQTSVSDQMDNFLIGFHEIIPKDLIAIFDEQELELLISGLPDINVSDWQSNTVYNNYSPSSIQIQWFWRAVKSFDNEERAKLLQFATGTSKVPLNGFKELSGANGTCKFSIHRDYGSVDRLPSSHTCFNQIDLPAYDTYETLRGSLLLALTEGHEGFGLA